MPQELELLLQPLIMRFDMELLGLKPMPEAGFQPFSLRTHGAGEKTH